MLSNLLSRSLTRMSVAFVIILSLTGCGKFGQKPDISRILKFDQGSTGCLNDFGNNIRDYMNGDIAPVKWTGTIDCAIDASTLFRQNIKGSIDNGYTASDMQKFVNNFLMTNKQVSNDFIQAAFDLKAALFGGTNQAITYNELDRVIDLFKIIRDQSTSLIPYLYNRKNDATPTHLLELADGIAHLGNTISSNLHTENNRIFPGTSAEKMVRELTVLFPDPTNPAKPFPILVEDVAPYLAVLTFLTHGSGAGISGDMWPKLIQLGTSLGGPLLAAATLDRTKLTGPNEYGNFLYGMFLRIEAVLRDVVQWHSGVITNDWFRWLISSVPGSWMEPAHYNDADNFPVEDWNPSWVMPPKDQRNTFESRISRAIEPVFRRLLGTQAIGPDGLALGVDAHALDTIHTLVTEINVTQTHLETIFQLGGFDKANFNTTQTDFTETALNYRKTLTNLNDIADVDRLIALAAKFPYSTFKQGEMQMTFDRSPYLSLTHFTILQMGQVAAKYAISRYSQVPNKDTVTQDDFKVLFAEFDDLLLAVGLMDRTSGNYPVQWQHHFWYANLFTYVSQGTDTMGVDTLANYLAFIVSAQGVAAKMRGTPPTPASPGVPYDPGVPGLEQACAPPGDDAERDPIGWKYMDYDCFAANFYGKEKYWGNFPGLLTHYGNINGTARENLITAMEIAARRKFFKKPDRIGSNDIGGYAGVFHYVETIFRRYDQDNNQSLNYNEVMDAFPLFKGKIKTIVAASGTTIINPNDDQALKAILTYMVKSGHAPGAVPGHTLPEQKNDAANIGDQLSFLFWWGFPIGWKGIEADRSTLYQIVSTL